MGNEDRKNPHQNSNIYREVLILECSWLFRWIDICIEKLSFQPRNDVIAFCFCVDFSMWNSFSWTYTLHDANWLPSNTHNYPARKHARILTPAFLNKCNIQGPLPTQTMHFLRATASTKLPSALFDPRKTQMDILIICKYKMRKLEANINKTMSIYCMKNKKSNMYTKKNVQKIFTSNGCNTIWKTTPCISDWTYEPWNDLVQDRHLVAVSDRSLLRSRPPGNMQFMPILLCELPQWWAKHEIPGARGKRRTVETMAR